MSLIMKSSTTAFNTFSSSFYFFFFILFSSIFVRVVVAFGLLNSEGEALLSLLNNNFSLEEYSDKKLDWNNLSSSNTSSPCDWVGIGCNTQNTHVVSLNLSGYWISGQLGPQIGRLSYLKSLDLSGNGFNGSVPIELWNCSHLQHLDLSWNIRLGEPGFSGQLGPQIGRLRYLKSLDLSYNSFTDSIPAELWNCSRLQHLDLSWNKFSGELPTTTVRNLQQLIYFSASGNYLIGRIPETLFESSGLEYVNLGQNYLNGSIPFNIGNATNMKTLVMGFDLSYRVRSRGELLLKNNQLHGSIPNSITNCTKLEVLDLSNNGGLSGEIPLGLWRIPTLAYINVRNNNLSGDLPGEMTTGLHHLRTISLSNNHFLGSIPEALGINITNLEVVDFSNNTFFGEIPPNLCFGKQLQEMRLGLNKLHGSIPSSYTKNCYSLQELALEENNLNGSLPHFEENSSLSTLDISGNSIHGKIPSSICYLSSLDTHDLSHNLMNGTLPQCLGDLAIIVSMSLRNNDFNGIIPSSICYLNGSLEILDLSDNQMNGMIPHCLGDLALITSMNLRSNDFSGTIPPNFTSDQLYKLDLNGNRFEGKIPRIHSPRLTYLDLGNNQLNDTFPFFLEEILSNSLEILVLRSNKLYGPLKRLHSNSTFSELKVLDISSNYFTGDLPLEFILGLDAMIQINNVDNPDSIQYPQTSSVVIHKGVETRLNRTFMLEFRAIDMSNNTFQGTIPRSIGELVWLKMLNLSNNNLNGRIPSSLGNLTRLESLDLSQNKLSGEIPSHLTNIQFLSVLNLSHNNLTGPIPEGGQFSTFTNDSFSGNSGLCGSQISKKCGDDANETNRRDPIEEKPSHEDSNNPWSFGWEPVVIGYGCGVLIGLVIQYFVFTKAFLYRWFG